MSDSLLFNIILVDRTFDRTETIGFYDGHPAGRKYPIPRVGEKIIHSYEPHPVVKEVIYDYNKKAIYIVI